MERKSNVSLEYYHSNLYMPLYNQIKIYKKAYMEFKHGDIQIENSDFQNIAIIQGTLDKTVLCDEIKKFCKNKNIKLKIINGGKHELYDFDQDIIKFLFKQLMDEKN